MAGADINNKSDARSRATELEHQLEQLLDVELFEPPADFRPHRQPPSASGHDRQAIADF